MISSDRKFHNRIILKRKYFLFMILTNCIENFYAIFYEEKMKTIQKKRGRGRRKSIKSYEHWALIKCNPTRDSNQNWIQSVVFQEQIYMQQKYTYCNRPFSHASSIYRFFFSFPSFLLVIADRIFDFFSIYFWMTSLVEGIPM